MPSSPGYPIPAATSRAEQVIQRSRFIATVAHADSAEAARAFLDEVRAEMPDATHHCWAYVAGPPGDSAFIGMSDAGEPHGTAGRPMLDVLLHSGVGEVAAVVTRYYGGTNLGKGGLVRAYGGAVQAALEAAPRALKVERVEVSVEVDYAAVDLLRRLLQELGGHVTDERYGATVTYRADLPAASLEQLHARLADATAGAARVTLLEDGAS